MALVFATYNTHGCVGRDGRFDPGRTSEVLKALQADVIALQEVEGTPEERDSPLHFLAREAGLQAIAGPTLQRKTGQYGNALLMRWRAVEIRRLDLSIHGREPRGALDVVLNSHGIRIQVVATHLGLNPKERRVQIERLASAVRVADAGCTVLMGDINEWFLWGRPLRKLHALLDETPAPATFPAWCPIFALDRIWVKPRAILTNLSVCRNRATATASDHLPLKAQIDLRHLGRRGGHRIIRRGPNSDAWPQ